MGQYFRLHGLSGFLIAVALLLSILAFLVTTAVSVQSSQASNYYKISAPTEIEQFNSNSREKHVIDAK
jgi:purine-cytosine permease-like protein